MFQRKDFCDWPNFCNPKYGDSLGRYLWSFDGVNGHWVSLELKVTLNTPGQFDRHVHIDYNNTLKFRLVSISAGNLIIYIPYRYIYKDT